MFETALEVEFGPHLVDWLMVGLTTGSIAASIVLGWLAYQNGKRATDIANESATRDHAQRLRIEEMQTSELERQARVRRVEFGAVLRRRVNEIISKKESLTGEGYGTFEESLDRLSATTGEKNSEDLRGYVLERAWHGREPYKGMSIYLATLRECLESIDQWVERPSSFTSTQMNAWKDHIKAIERLKKVALDQEEHLETILKSALESED